MERFIVSWFKGNDADSLTYSDACETIDECLDSMIEQFSEVDWEDAKSYLAEDIENGWIEWESGKAITRESLIAYIKEDYFNHDDKKHPVGFVNEVIKVNVRGL